MRTDASDRPVHVTSCRHPIRGRIVVQIWEYPGQPYWLHSVQGGEIVATWSHDDVRDPAEALQRVFPDSTDHGPLVPAQLLPGEYHPRIWRNGIDATWIRDNTSAMNTGAIPTIRQRVIALHRIQRQLENVFEVVTPNTEHAEVYGEATGQILTLAATEIEQLLKEVFVANSDPAQRAHLFRSLNMGALFALVAPMRLREWEARLQFFDDWPAIRPFEAWTNGAVPPWWTAYNARKHDPAGRSESTLINAISAVAAVHVLLEAQFGPGIENLLLQTGTSTLGITAKPTWADVELYSPATEYHQHGTFRERLLFQ